KAARFPGARDTAEYRIALVKVEDAILGARGITHIRVGFLPPPPPPQGGPGIRPRFRPPFRSVNFTEGLEACLFLTRHFDGHFYTAPAYFDVIEKKGNTTFAREVDEARQAAKLLDDPTAGLTAGKADDRFLTAAL